MKLPIIQSLWGCYDGELVSNLEKLCIKSFLDNGHDFHLYCYYDIANLPSVTAGGGKLIIKDANEIRPESDIFLHKSGSYAIFADWFRLSLLAKCGGVWVDMDMVCLKPLDFPPEQIVIASESAQLCTNALMMFPKAHPFIVALEQNFHAFQDKANSSWGEIGGPTGLTKAIKEHSMQKYIFPVSCFQPISYSEWHTAFDNTYATDIGFFQSTYSVHLYNHAGNLYDEHGKRFRLNKNACFDPQSLFEQLKAKHGIENLPNANRITSAQLNGILAIRNNAESENRKNRIKRERLLFLLIAFAIGLTAGLLL